MVKRGFLEGILGSNSQFRVDLADTTAGWHTLTFSHASSNSTGAGVRAPGIIGTTLKRALLFRPRWLMVRPFGVEIRVAVQLALISAVAAVVQGFGDSQTGFSEDILGSNPQFRVDLADTTAGW